MQSSLPWHKKYRVVIVTCTIVAGVVVAIWGMNIWRHVNEPLRTQEAMQSHLQDKYKRDFVVTNIRTEGAGFGVEGDVTADAASTGNDPLKFKIWEDPPGRYHDTYLDTLWSKQESQDFNKFISEQDIRPARQHITITAQSRLADTLTGIPTLQDTLQTHSKDITYGAVVVRQGEQVTEQDKNNLRKIIEYAKSHNPANYAARYVINSGTQDSRYLCQYYGGDANGARDAAAEEHYISACFTHVTGRE